MDDFLKIDRMTFYEYELRIKASRLRILDREYELHKLAWITQQAGASKKNGKPVFRGFKQFFDFEKAEKEVLAGKHKKPAPINKRIIQAMRKQKKGGESDVGI